MRDSPVTPFLCCFLQFMLAKYDRPKQPVTLHLLSAFMYTFVRRCGMVYSANTDGGDTLIATWRILPVTDYEVKDDPGVL